MKYINIIIFLLACYLFFDMPLCALNREVTVTIDAGAGSLRQAIIDINVAGETSNNITFNIPGTGPHSIAPASALPSINFPTNINGYSQPGTNITTRSAKIVLDGLLTNTGVHGLEITNGASESIIQGLIIERFGGDGIFLNNSNGCKIIANVIGSPFDQTLGNGNQGITAIGSNNLISCNVIGNNGRVASLNPGAGILVSEATSRENIIFSNTDFVNKTSGIVLDTGANNNQTAPVITLAQKSGSFIILAGTLVSIPNTTFRLQFFTNEQNRNPITEGQTFESQIDVTTDVSGNASFSTVFGSLAKVEQFVSATATRLVDGTPNETSQYSLNKEITQGPLLSALVEALLKKYCVINFNITELCGADINLIVNPI